VALVIVFSLLQISNLWLPDLSIARGNRESEDPHSYVSQDRVGQIRNPHQSMLRRVK